MAAISEHFYCKIPIRFYCSCIWVESRSDVCVEFALFMKAAGLVVAC